MKNIRNFLAGLEILSKYYDEGLDTDYFMEAGHDVVWFHITEEALPVDSDDGTLLLSYGFDTDADLEVWGYNP